MSKAHALKITSAEVNGNRHVFRFVLQCRVDHLSIALWQRRKVLSSSSCSLAHILVTQIGEIGIVQLKQLAAGFGQRRNFVTISLSQVFEELIKVRVHFFRDSLSASTEMTHCWTGDRHLDAHIVTLTFDSLLKELEVVHFDVVCMVHFTSDVQCQLSRLVLTIMILEFLGAKFDAA